MRYITFASNKKDVEVKVSVHHAASGRSAIFDGDRLVLDQPGTWVVKIRSKRQRTKFLLKLRTDGTVEFPPLISINISDL